MRLEFTLAGVSPLIMHKRPDSTREALSASRSQRLRRSEAATEPTSTTGDSESSSASGPSISTLTADPRYRRQRFGH